MAIDPDVTTELDALRARLDDGAPVVSEILRRLDEHGGAIAALQALHQTPAPGSPPTIHDQQLSIDEDAAVGSVVGPIVADGAETYAIVAGNDGGVFVLDALTGTLSLAAALDYETVAFYALSIQVSNQHGSATASVNVMVGDVDETVPPPDPAPNPDAFVVGPGQAFASLSALPWSTMPDGAEIRVMYRAAPYREKFVLSRPVTIRGILGPAGERPVIDGTDATTATPWDGPNPDRGVITIGNRPTDPWGARPVGITIEGVSVRGAYGDAAGGTRSFTTRDGSRQHYRTNAAGIYIERGGEVTIRNCEVTDCSNGIFGAASDGGDPRHPDALMVSDVLVEDCYLHGNGVRNDGRGNSDRQHNSYLESRHATYRDCVYGSVREGTWGAMLKDRSSFTVVEGCRFDGTASYVLDLVEPEESARIIIGPEGWDTVALRGCQITVPANRASRLIHLGWDNGGPRTQTKRLLVVDGLDITLRTDRALSWRKVVFACQGVLYGVSQRVEARRVTVRRTLAPGATQHSLLSLLDSAGELEFYGGADASAISAVTPAWTPYRDGESPQPGSTVIGPELVQVLE